MSNPEVSGRGSGEGSVGTFYWGGQEEWDKELWERWTGGDKQLGCKQIKVIKMNVKVFL